jgi:hypothetical protein
VIPTLFDAQDIIFGFFDRNFEKFPVAGGRMIFLQKLDATK